MSAETLSDLLGLASGLVLLISAFRNDGLDALITKLSASIESAKKGGKEDPKAQVVMTALKKERETWNLFDRFALHLGAGLLLASFAFKVGPKILIGLGWMAKAPCAC